MVALDVDNRGLLPGRGGAEQAEEAAVVDDEQVHDVAREAADVALGAVEVVGLEEELREEDVVAQLRLSLQMAEDPAHMQGRGVGDVLHLVGSAYPEHRDNLEFYPLVLHLEIIPRARQPLDIRKDAQRHCEERREVVLGVPAVEAHEAVAVEVVLEERAFRSRAAEHDLC